MRGLWLPYETADLDGATRFYTALGLERVDGWDRDGERGVVLRVPGPAYVELVAYDRAGRPSPTPSDPTRTPPGSNGPALGPGLAPLAFEFDTPAAVLAEHRRLGGRAPARYPRGHFGFDLRGPDGTPLMIWSET
ncbi:VOC family protein [Longispora sp. K20-0274]|uniref:VOC family protein n=1 Tax=Longispora sp. K20-0274 TaxID=3088255 RepID=UPI00399B16CF